MEEKKTKKMTKAEAFEYLKGTRVYCGDYAIEVQRKIFETGVEWAYGGSNLSKAPYLFVSIDGRLTLCFDNNWFKNHDYREISADDILSIEIVEEKNEKFVDCSEPCDEIKAVQELLRNSKHLKNKTLVITKDNAAIL